MDGMEGAYGAFVYLFFFFFFLFSFFFLFFTAIPGPPTLGLPSWCVLYPFFLLLSYFSFFFLSFTVILGPPVLGLPSHSSAPPTHPTSSLRRPCPCARGSNASNSAGCDSLGHTWLVRGWRCLWPRAGALHSSVASATRPRRAPGSNGPSSQVVWRAEACTTARVPDWLPHLLEHGTAHSDPSPECRIRARL